MQENTITVPVDLLNTGSTTDEVYRRQEENAGKSVYILEAVHSLIKRHMFSLFRTHPKKVGNFRGMAKSAVKFTQDLDIPGVDSTTTLTTPLIAEASFSIPVGATAAQVLEARQRLVAILDDDVVMVRLSEQMEY